jgi:hypothetical protein
MKRIQGEMPIFVKTFDLLAWLVPAANHFPRLHRHTITRRLLDSALDFQECVLEANELRGTSRLERLRQADAHLNKVRLYLRLIHRLTWINLGQYEHASRMLAEVGRLLGAWQKTVQS